MLTVYPVEANRLGVTHRPGPSEVSNCGAAFGTYDGSGVAFDPCRSTPRIAVVTTSMLTIFTIGS